MQTTGNLQAALDGNLPMIIRNVTNFRRAYQRLQGPCELLLDVLLKQNRVPTRTDPNGYHPTSEPIPNIPNGKVTLHYSQNTHPEQQDGTVPPYEVTFQGLHLTYPHDYPGTPVQVPPFMALLGAFWATSEWGTDPPQALNIRFIQCRLSQHLLSSLQHGLAGNCALGALILTNCTIFHDIGMPQGLAGGLPLPDRLILQHAHAWTNIQSLDMHTTLRQMALLRGLQALAQPLPGLRICKVTFHTQELPDETDLTCLAMLVHNCPSLERLELLNVPYWSMMTNTGAPIDAGRTTLHSIQDIHDPLTLRRVYNFIETFCRGPWPPPSAHSQFANLQLKFSE
ncbi:hypothetical protein OH77DRAFT_1439417 [Trametes cingulata]|nr:hypothetical protein OH77DRAFT_1439417 [Trametes cingulata]